MKPLAFFCMSVVAFAAKQSDQVRLGSEDVLITSSVTVPLTHTAALTLSTDRTLNLDPGVRMTRIENGYSLATYDGKNINLELGAEWVALPSPSTIRLTDSGWDLGTGKTYRSSVLTAHRAVQDDTDSNLKSMQDSAKKLKTKSNESQDEKKSGKKSHLRRLFGEDPMATAELFNSEAIQQLTHLSPNGF